MVESQENCEWIIKIDEKISHSIISLIDSTIADCGILGFRKPLSETQAKTYIHELGRNISGGDTHVLPGHCNEHPVFMVILTQSDMENCRHRAELSKGVIHPLYRGQGLVRVAFRELVRHADKPGIEQFVLDVRDGRRAHLLWKHYGFVGFGVLEDYARVGGRVGNISHRGHFMTQTVDSLRQRVFPSSHT